jgi:hypothetical protein
VFITSPAVLDLGGSLGLQVDLVQLNRLEVFDVRSRITGCKIVLLVWGGAKSR